MAADSKSSQQPDLIIPEVILLSEEAMKAPHNLVYSTAPRLGLDSNGRRYCVKGHGELDIVLGELVGHTLAGYLNVTVPHFAVGRFHPNRHPLFSSLIVEDVIRDVEFHLKANKVADLASLSRIILLDIWLANNDRNIGNLLGCPRPDSGKGHISLLAIDFEKTLVIRSKAPLIEIPVKIPRGALWPRGMLGTYCKGRALLDDKFLAEVKAITPLQIENAVKASYAAANVDDSSRMTMVVDTLLSRQNQIEQLAKAEWN